MGGHGTHVSGSVLGNGCRSGSNGLPTGYAGSYAGLAPQARLVMQSAMDSSCGLAGLPDDLNTLFTQARDAGARIHTNSWGEVVAGQYTTYSRTADEFTWNNKDAAILFAAGNSGVDANSDGFVDADSLSAPGTAKNVITVGASENDRTTGGYNPGGACSTWGSCFFDPQLFTPLYPAEPISSDGLSDDPTGMAAFSSRGPTDDGRIKPDVVAPGTNILSTKSQAQYVSGGWGDGPNQYYQYMGGTSMATPLTAGAVALIRQFYTDIEGITPSGALLKATLINSATDLYPGQYTHRRSTARASPTLPRAGAASTWPTPPTTPTSGRTSPTLAAWRPAPATTIPTSVRRLGSQGNPRLDRLSRRHAGRQGAGERPGPGRHRARRHDYVPRQRLQQRLERNRRFGRSHQQRRERLSPDAGSRRLEHHGQRVQRAQRQRRQAGLCAGG